MIKLRNTLYLLLICAIPTLCNAAVAPDPIKETVGDFLKSQTSAEPGLSEDAETKGYVVSDLDHDGREEIILVWETLGPTYWHNTLTIFSQIKGKYTPISSLPLNGVASRPFVKGGIIHVDQILYKKGEPLCCPTDKRDMKYFWKDHKLVTVE